MDLFIRGGVINSGAHACPCHAHTATHTHTHAAALCMCVCVPFLFKRVLPDKISIISSLQ